ncbi:SP_1767 family glycosyltransferase [Lactobacillus selangorensis]|nr:SP_1767 family glycosyltransferase [Lactobacillus selangorensis]
MKKWVTRIITNQHDDLLLKEAQDYTEFVHELGYDYVNIETYQRNDESYEALTARIDGILAGVKPGDLLIYQYPSHIDEQFEMTFIERASFRGIYIVPVVHDYKRLHFYNPGFDEARLLRISRANIIPTQAMEAELRQEAVGTPFLLQNCWDFKTDKSFSEALPDKKVILAGHDQDSDVITNWSVNAPIIAIGNYNHPDSNVIRTTSTHEMIDKMPNGFGLARHGDNYSKYNLPCEVVMYLALGMPVFVWQGPPAAQLVTENHLGYAIQSVDEIDSIFAALHDSDLWNLQRRVQAFGTMLRNGYFTRQAVLKTEQLYLDRDWKLQIHDKPALINNIHVMGIMATIDYILDHHASVARLGDGEFDIIRGTAIAYQSANQALAQRLKEVLAYQSDQHLLICLPDVFGRLTQYTADAQTFWHQLRSKAIKMFKDIDTSGIYGNANLSRPYFIYEDRAEVGARFRKLKEIWANQDILIVEGKNTRSGEGNDLFKNAHSLQRILCPSQNAYDKIDEIEAAIETFGKGKLVLLMLGPTAKIITYDLFSKGYWLIDTGHIDTEYEWYQMGVRLTKVKIPHKHTAEFDQDVEDLESDPAFDKQVVVDLSE